MGTTRKTLAIYWQFSKRYKLAMILTLLLPIVATLTADVVRPYATSRILDLLPEANNTVSVQQDIIRLIWLIIGLTVINFIAWRTNGYYYIKQQAKTMRDLEQYIFGRLINHSYTFFANRFGGALVAQANRFVNSYERLEDIVVYEVIPPLIRFSFAAGILLWRIPPVGIALLVWGFVFAISVTFLSIKKLPYSKKAAADDSKVTGALADGIANVNDIKSYARYKFETGRFGNISQRRFERRLKSWYLDEWIRGYMSVCVGIFEILILWLSVRAVFNHSASIGIVLLAQFYSHKIMNDLWSLNQVIRRTEFSLADAAEMTQILSLTPDIADPDQPAAPKIRRGHIRFENVTFSYPDSKQRPLFKNFSITVKPGEKVGLVGPSGGGKTTVTKLLLRFLDIDSGQILIDDQDITTISQEALRDHIASVPQEPLLFHRSLTENIRYGRLDASDKEVRAVARLANAAGFIEQLPNGYKTLVGERGVKLSGGQRQRVAIARAMLKNAPILVLDEATSALDSESEALIQDALWKLMEGRTAIVIAHRLSTIQRMDRIVVLDEGRIVEEGSHTELLQKNGLYAKLWTHQSGGFLQEDQ